MLPEPRVGGPRAPPDRRPRAARGHGLRFAVVPGVPVRLTRRQRLIRRFLPLVTTLTVGVVLLVWVLASGGSSGGVRAAGPVPARPAPPTTVTTTTTTAPPPPTTTTDPGTLPQTGALPAAGDPTFTSRMAALWSAVVQDAPAAAQPAFFPETAYLQVKSIADPSADWQDRLVAQFGLDISAAHALLGPDAAQAVLDTVQVPQAYAHWVPPGVCENRIGYFEVANSRMVYTLAGQTRSFGIASLISWRGQWYVVHLGAVVPSGAGGQVLDPEIGPGTSPPSSTC